MGTDFSVPNFTYVREKSPAVHRRHAMKQTTNTYAQHYAKKLCGNLESYRGLHLVTYNYGSAPSLIYWRGNQRKYIRNIHFISLEMRNNHIAILKAQQDSSVLFRITRRFRKHLLTRAASIMA